MRERIIDFGNGFWNIRGSFKLGGLIEIGTQASLVRLSDGRFVMLDSYTIPRELLAELDQITGGRDNVVAVINLHPFHTLHSEAMHEDFPNARHFGTSRHLRKYPDLGWEKTTTEDLVIGTEFAEDLDFSLPAGVELVPANENIHCGSILAYHRASKTIHVDDTFNLRGAKKGKPGKLSVHLTLGAALEDRPGAASDFRDWGASITERWSGAQRICVAHAGVMTAEKLGEPSVNVAMKAALQAAEKKLRKHEAKHG